ncbi:phosphotransferase [Anditalea andensis]|nr:phosphotransferase [Anditalea andensis]
MKYDISPTDLNDLLRTISIQKQHPLFEFCLSRADYTLDLSYCKSHPSKEFIYAGRGHHTIKPYRILGERKKRLFEKIFYTDSQDARANIAFYENHKEWLKNTDITIPRCKDIIIGEKFTAFLFEYLDLQPLYSGREYQSLKKATFSLCKGTERRKVADHTSYEKIVDGQARIKKLKIFSRQEMAIIKEYRKTMPVYFQHLDLKEENVFNGNVVVDWDNAGWHPMGMDFGRLLLSFYIFHKEQFYDKYLEEIYSFYDYIEDDIPFKPFHHTVLYYFIVFFYGHFCENNETKKFMNLIDTYKKKLSENRLV